MEEIKAGDTVQLKSGGEFMTVESVDEYGANCVWFESKKVQRHTFETVALKKASPGIGIG